MLALMASVLIGPPQATAEVYELRTYTTNEGKLDNLNARFRDHTVELFDKHGMESVGYWVPVKEPLSKNTLIYVIKHESLEAAKASWKAFLADPEWKKAARESQVDGQILAKAPDSVFMTLADYSPKLPTDESDDDAAKSDEAVFELRVYRTNKGKLPGLDTRFADHTIELFKRHGIESVAYWHPLEEPAADDTLIYIIKHESPEVAKASWKAFSADDQWQKVAKESQQDGRFLRERPESTYMKATDYSDIR
jgi:hypothetical protein